MESWSHVSCHVFSFSAAPKVVVYSRDPGEFGKPNHFICHVNNFHPPDIKIELLQNGKELPEPKQTDLAFKQDWHFHLTKSAPFTPEADDKVICRVTHNGVPKEYSWGEYFLLPTNTNNKNRKTLIIRIVSNWKVSGEVNVFKMISKMYIFLQNIIKNDFKISISCLFNVWNLFLFIYVRLL